MPACCCYDNIICSESINEISQSYYVDRGRPMGAIRKYYYVSFSILMQTVTLANANKIHFKHVTRETAKQMPPLIAILKVIALVKS